MTAPTHSRAALLLRAAVPVALLAFVAAILLRFPPAQYSFYPQCPIHRYFGILCPGCGTTRALAALLHGNLGEAFRLNALTMLLLPIAAGYAFAGYSRLLARRPGWPQPPRPAIYATLAAAAIFTVARNL